MSCQWKEKHSAVTPQSLDEAAEEAIKKAYPGDAYYYVGRPARRLFKEGFKAGAKWMAEQGINTDGKTRGKLKVLLNPTIERTIELEHHGWIFVSAVKDKDGNTSYTYRKDADKRR